MPTKKSPKTGSELSVKTAKPKDSATPKAPKKAPAKTTRKKKGVKATPSKVGVGISLDPKPPLHEPVISHDEISLRAYFIAERRHKMGWPGDSATDWADAVKQLRAEALEKPLKKR